MMGGWGLRREGGGGGGAQAKGTGEEMCNK